MNSHTSENLNDDMKVVDIDVVNPVAFTAKDDEGNLYSKGKVFRKYTRKKADSLLDENLTPDDAGFYKNTAPTNEKLHRVYNRRARTRKFLNWVAATGLANMGGGDVESLTPKLPGANAWQIYKNLNEGNDQAVEESLSAQHEFDKQLATTKGAVATAALAAPIVLQAVSPAITHGLTVLANPMAAKTTVGALTALGLDVAGTVFGAKRNAELLNKWRNRQFDNTDIPEFTLNLIPGYVATKAVSGAKNMSTILRAPGNLTTKVQKAKDLLHSPSPAMLPSPITEASKAEKITKATLGRLDKLYHNAYFSKPAQAVRKKLLASNAKWLDKRSKVGEWILKWRLPKKEIERLVRQAHEYDNLQLARIGKDASNKPQTTLNVTIPTWRERFKNALGEFELSTGKHYVVAWAGNGKISFPVSTLIRPKSFLKQFHWNPKNVFAHEMRHIIQDNFNWGYTLPNTDFRKMRLPDLTRESVFGEYYGANAPWAYYADEPSARYLWDTSLELGRQAPDTWTKSINEFDADMATLRERLDEPLTPYNDLPDSKKEFINNWMANRFGIDKRLANELALKLSLAGYKNGGKL